MLKILTLILLSLIIAFYLLLTPTYLTQLHYQNQTIRIQRDHLAIPHIHAPSRKAFLYALGHVLAEDRLFQMAFRRLYGSGRLSEFLGQKALYSDIMMRDLGFTQLTEHLQVQTKAQNQTIFLDLSALVSGINDQVAQRLILPLEFHLLNLPWQNYTIAHIYLGNKIVEWALSHNLFDQYARSALLAHLTPQQINDIMPNTEQHWAFPSATEIQADQIPQHLYGINTIGELLFDSIQIHRVISFGAPDFLISGQGSNAWVVSGAHTQSGKPIISNDPHMDNVLPSSAYLLRATYTHNHKTIRFAGLNPAGVLLLVGKTDYLACANTVIQTDTQDLYQETLQNNHYLYQTNWKPLKTRNETIIVKTPQGKKLHQHTVRLTHRGPIMTYLVGAAGTYQLTDPISLAWAGLNQDYQSMANGLYIYEIDNFQELSHHLQNYTAYGFSINYLAATADNHILYQHAGPSPIRKNVKSGSYVKNGTSSEHDWLGFLAPSQHLHIIDPPRGYLVSANNRASPAQFQAGYFSHTIFTARADRLQELISSQIASGRKITNDFAISLFYDTVDVYCRQILPKIIQTLPVAQKILANFTCDFTSSSAQATIYEVFLQQLWNTIKPTSHPNVSTLALHTTQQGLYKHIQTAHAGNTHKREQLTQAWNLMNHTLTEFFHSQNTQLWRWGQYHKEITKQLPFGQSPTLAWLYNREHEGYGNLHTVNIARSNKLQLNNFDISHRAVYRGLYDFGGPSWFAMDGGTSQNPLSPHYDDQYHSFLAHQLLPLFPTHSPAIHQL